MKGTRHQEGYLYRKGSLWLLRYYDSEFVANGSIRRVQKTKKLANVGPECPTKTAARDLAREFLESINLARNTPESAMTLLRFTEDRYLPFVEMHKRISTFRGYRNMWRRYLKPRVEITLREFRTVDGERLLQSIAKEHKLTCTTLAHIKAFLSGVFRFAKRQGVINSENPMRDVVLPKGKPPGETHAYSLEEHRADARRAARAGRHDCGSGRIHGCTKRRSARVPLGELRWGADPYLPVLLEGPRAGAKDSKE